MNQSPRLSSVSPPAAEVTVQRMGVFRAQQWEGILGATGCVLPSAPATHPHHPEWTAALPTSYITDTFRYFAACLDDRSTQSMTTRGVTFPRQCPPSALTHRGGQVTTTAQSLTKTNQQLKKNSGIHVALPLLTARAQPGNTTPLVANREVPPSFRSLPPQ